MLVAGDVRYLFRGLSNSVPSAPELEDGGVDWWRRQEGVARDLQTAAGSETSQVSAPFLCHATYDGSLQDEVCSDEVRRSGHECQYRGGERIRRVGHQPEWPPRLDEILQVTLHHGGSMTVHHCPKLTCPSCMQFDCDHAGASFEKWQSERAGACPKIDDQFAPPNGRGSDDPLSPVRIQPVPAPRPPPGHDPP